MSEKILVCWIGGTDLAASRGELDGQVGPIANAVDGKEFAAAHLLFNYERPECETYSKWLQSLTKTKIELHEATLDSPTNYQEIYLAASELVDSLNLDSRQLVFHLSPGTPAMSAVWVLMATTKYPAELIESSKESGLRSVKIPFDISADFIPVVSKTDSNAIEKLVAGLPEQSADFEKIVHRCAEMKRLIAQARRLAIFDVPVLIQGESGTGKELFARAIHAETPVRNKKSKEPITANCGAIPANLVDSTLFGHEKGAFTGATGRHIGLLELADGGTLFLDEIGELPLDSQVRLLRAFQEKKFCRVGGTTPVESNFRIIAATNRDLLSEVVAHRFREDLFHRIAVGVISLPPIRERSGDLNLLINFALQAVNQKCEHLTDWKEKRLSAKARKLLLQHPWYGNVRELLNTLARTAIWNTSATISADEVSKSLFRYRRKENDANILGRPLGNGFDLNAVISEVARHYLERAIDQSPGNKTKAAALIGAKSATTFDNWVKKHIGEGV